MSSIDLKIPEKVALLLREGERAPIWVYDRKLEAEFAPTEWWVTRDDGWFPKTPSDKILATAEVLDERFWGSAPPWRPNPPWLRSPFREDVAIAPSWEQLASRRKVDP